ncbi:MAG: hypothetical protein CMD32_04850 [Flavobacteriales bacterium]|jgi:hypoxanthine phosphoribosyltransferase|nr:hypothetical protein [Flavobacteriales bacterium]|tara:strand:+ start:8166 stop:8609 length:444 start_codon:yes stop_codon:yes gene_type:complete
MKKTFDINQMKTALSKITKQIYNSNWMPEIILSVNRGGCVPGIYLSHEINIPHKVIDVQLRDSKNKPNLDVLEYSINKYDSILIIDDINDTGATFDLIHKNIKATNKDIRYAVLVDNTSSNFKTQFKGTIIDKSKNPIWIVFPWEKN